MTEDFAEQPVRSRLVVGAFGLAAAAIGLMAFVGLIFGAGLLASLGSDKIPMAPSTALLFFLYGSALFLRAYLPMNRGIRRITLTVNVAGAALALLLFCLSYLKIYLSIEKLGIGISGTVGGAPVGHMSPLTAFCFLLSSLSFLSLLSKSLNQTARKAVAFWSAGLLAVMSITLILAYLYGTPLLYGSSFIPPAATTSLAFLALATALLVSTGCHNRSQKEGIREDGPFSYFLGLFFLILTVGIVAAGYFYYRTYEKHYRAGVEKQLSAIADLKVRDLVEWRKQRLGDASVYYGNDNFSGLVRRYLEAPQDADTSRRLKTWLVKVRSAHEYDRVLLLDARGLVRMSDPESPESAVPHLVRDVSEVLGSGKMTLLDFHRHSPDGPVFLEVILPILEERDGEFPLGALVLRIDPKTYLYPLIQSWPSDSATAETLLVRKEGEEVLFLNELRFRENSALNLRFPLDNNEDQPAVKAVLGKEGIVEGKDYLGVPVVVAVRAVPDSPWFLVARMDMSETYAPLGERLWTIIVLVGSLLIGTGAGMGHVWRRRQARFYEERYEAAEALRASEARYRSTLDSMLEGCQIIGFDWRYLYVNEETVRQSRRTKEELLGRRIMDVYPGITPTNTFAALQRCMVERTPVFLENEFAYPDGSMAWFSLSIQPVPEGIFILSMDITEQKQAEKREKHLNALVRAIRKVNQLITKEKDPDRLIQGACENLVTARGFNNAWLWLMDSYGKTARWAESGIGEDFGRLKESVERGQPPRCVRRALDRKEVAITTDTSIECPDCPLSPTYKGNASFCVRLEHNGKVHGVLAASVPRRFAFDQEEQGLFEEVADDIAFGLYNIEQEEIRSAVVRELSYSEARYRALFEGAGEGILIADIETKELKYANPAICKMLGYTEDELRRMSVKDIHTKNDLDRVISGFEAGAKNGKGLAQDVPCLRQDGSIIFADFNSTRTLIEGIPCNVAFVTDVTERKKSEDALKESEERFKTLFEYAPDAYYLHDLEGRLIDGNRAAERLIGYSKEELIGKSFMELGLLSAEELRKAAELLRKNVRGLATEPDEFILHRKDGKQVFVEVRTSPLTIGGRNVVLGIANDISERKSLEQQLRQSQKLEAIGRLSGGIAHDFNNLLTTVIGNAELILEDIPDDDPVREGIHEIKNAGERAASLTRQLLAFSRKQVLQPTVVNLNQTVLDMEKMLGRMIGEDIEFRTVLSPDLGQIEADVGQLEQVIMNLVVNARDAMPKGGKITIETGNVNIDEGYARAHIAVTPGPYVTMSVSDTGFGMSRETQGMIFEPFFTTKGKGKGTGLGLSMVYGIVKQSNGNIWVYSELGKGTTFKIYLPRVEKSASETEWKAEKSEPPSGSETVLVVEDDQMVREFAVRVLQRYGYNVLIAANGEEAIEIARVHQGPIHLMLTDVVMPGISSRDMEESLKSFRPEMRVLYMSGYTDNAIVHHGVLDPGKAFLGKPFTPNSLGRKVREVLDLPGTAK
ncbi:MAG: PAS domain S-box protein [Deltaproteobacteria bacterium]|nr:PAS domain S-box protein [Deltaproteobacteria bacterium]